MCVVFYVKCKVIIHSFLHVVDSLAYVRIGLLHALVFVVVDCDVF